MRPLPLTWLYLGVFSKAQLEKKQRDTHINLLFHNPVSHKAQITWWHSHEVGTARAPVWLVFSPHVQSCISQIAAFGVLIPTQDKSHSTQNFVQWLRLLAWLSWKGNKQHKLPTFRQKMALKQFGNCLEHWTLFNLICCALKFIPAGVKFLKFNVWLEDACPRQADCYEYSWADMKHLMISWLQKQDGISGPTLGSLKTWLHRFPSRRSTNRWSFWAEARGMTLQWRVFSRFGCHLCSGCGRLSIIIIAAVFGRFTWRLEMRSMCVHRWLNVTW